MIINEKSAWLGHSNPFGADSTVAGSADVDRGFGGGRCYSCAAQEHMHHSGVLISSRPCAPDDIAINYQLENYRRPYAQVFAAEKS